VEQYRRLLVFSVMENRPASDIVSQLIATHLRGWSMPGRVSPRDGSTDRQEASVHVEESAAA
jgi:hypothetical protein